MKELSIRDKAGRYDEAIKVPKSNYETIVQMDNDCTFAKEGIINTFHHMFPELKESEDERIRKAIIKFIKVSKPEWENYSDYSSWIAWLEKQGQTFTKKDVDDAYLKGISDAKKELEKQVEKVEPIEGFNTEFERQISQLIASIINKEHEYTEAFVKWTSDALLNYAKHEIDKQGEQKPILNFNAKDWYVSKVDGKIHDMTYNPADKVEPKFKIGDYIVNDYCAGKVVALTDDAYLLDTEQGIPFSCEHNVHLWTIQDAKDGDVLRLGCVIAIFKKYIGQEKCICYCSISEDKDFEIPIENGEDNIYGCIDATPATKEQRDTLMKAMADAGYTFDFEKKELKKIEQKSATMSLDEAIEHCKEKSYGNNACALEHKQLEKWLTELKELKEQKPAEWSEEDDYNLQCMIAKVISDIQKGNVGRNNELIDWLKSLKQKIGR